MKTEGRAPVDNPDEIDRVIFHHLWCFGVWHDWLTGALKKA
ncbi:hypothetical protein ACFOU2_16235 [Bacillus songklensis]|uniref:Uncharacterized protein n=1 Tax=Bacillus songklensis TaxID=1069116 RepID=A0ABV8B6Z1_9BACI